MNPAVLPLLCDPITRGPLELDGSSLLNPASQTRYPIVNGTPDFIALVTGKNRKYQQLYDRIAFLYDPAQRLYELWKPLEHVRNEYMRELDVPPRARVLEVSVGTGANLPFLPPGAELFGLDLSWGMLRRCIQNLRRWHRPAELFHGEAEHLPFRDEVFDAVFHVGGINFFNDRAAAIAEMIRVAKPGTKFVIVDETEKVVTGNYQRTPFVRKFFEKGTEQITTPLNLVPPEMRDIRSRLLFNDRLYSVTFRKP